MAYELTTSACGTLRPLLCNQKLRPSTYLSASFGRVPLIIAEFLPPHQILSTGIITNDTGSLESKKSITIRKNKNFSLKSMIHELPAGTQDNESLSFNLERLPIAKLSSDGRSQNQLQRLKIFPRGTEFNLAWALALKMCPLRLQHDFVNFLVKNEISCRLVWSAWSSPLRCADFLRECDPPYLWDMLRVASFRLAILLCEHPSTSHWCVSRCGELGSPHNAILDVLMA